MRSKGKKRNILPPPTPVRVLNDFLILLFLGQPPPPFSIPFLRTNCISACSLLALPEGSPPACLGPPTDCWLCLDRRTQLQRGNKLPVSKKEVSHLGSSKRQLYPAPYPRLPQGPYMANIQVASSPGCPNNTDGLMLGWS